MKFLTPELKNSYMRDFNENVLTCTHSQWKLDEGVKDILIEINKNSNIQTLYSKRNQGAPSRGTHPKKLFKASNWVSYLVLTISEQIPLNDFLPFEKHCIKKYGNKFILIASRQAEPISDDLIKLPVYMSCTKNKEHWNICNIWISIDSKNVNDHNEFWSDIEKYLTQL